MFTKTGIPQGLGGEVRSAFCGHCGRESARRGEKDEIGEPHRAEKDGTDASGISGHL